MLCEKALTQTQRLRDGYAISDNTGFCTFVWIPDQQSKIYWAKDAHVFLELDTVAEIETQKTYHDIIVSDNKKNRLTWVDRAENHDIFESMYTLSFAPDRMLHETLICTYCPTHKTKQVYGIIRDAAKQTPDKSQDTSSTMPSNSPKYLDNKQFKKHIEHTIAYSSRYNVSAGYMRIEVSSPTSCPKVLAAISTLVEKTIISAVRDADIVGNYSSKKFGVILTRCTHAGLRSTAYRIIREVNQIKSPELNVPIHINIAGAMIPGAAKTADKLDTLAQNTLKYCIDIGPNEFLFCDPEQETSSQYALIVNAISQNRIAIAFQPVVSASQQNTVSFYECLARLIDEDNNAIPAFKFIPVVEGMGLVHVMDRKILEKIFHILHNNSNLTLSLNITPNSIEDLYWSKTYKKLAKKHPDAAKRLIVEITETLSVSDIQKMADFLRSLQQHGTRIAIDDFGAGFTSFRYFRDLPVDILKIDGSYVKNISNEPENQILVRSITTLAKEFGIEVVAEFVETQEDADMLSSYGLNYLQGYYFGKPEMTLPK